MPIPDPPPNGEPPPKSDDFEMNLEPVDPAELSIENAPMVEAVEPPPRKRGFGFWMAFVWCIIFLATTQMLPSTILTVIYIGPIMKELDRIKEDARKAPPGGIDFSGTIKRYLESPAIKEMTQIAVIAGPACGILFCVLFIPRVVGKEWRRRLAVRRPHLEHVVLILLLFLPIFVFNIAFESLTSRLPPWLEDFNLPGMKEVMESMLKWPALVVTLGIAVGPAVSEELFCRAFLGHGLVRRFGTRLGVILTSFFFGLIHLSLIQSVYAVAMGIVLHSVYLATRSLLAPILLHFVHNFFALPAETEAIPIYLGSSLQHAFNINPWLMLLASILMFAALAWAFWTSRVRIWSADGKEQFYYHVALPDESSGDRARMGPIPLIVVGALIATCAFFAAIWFGI